MDASTKQVAQIRLFGNSKPLDNPMQSEICSHIGGQGNMFCHRCHAGGTQIEKASDDGYH